jgi:ABC-2 type transport system ATP-binding protein
MQAAICVKDVSKRFGRKVVLDRVSFDVPAGIVFALLGENGAGKTTLIRSMLGYHRLDQGTIEVLGLDASKKPLDIRKRIGYVSDAPAMYDWMKVKDIGWFASGFYPKGFLERYQELANQFELPASTKIRDLSKGMRSKVALALAMASDPALLILDEPTSGLDPLVRRQFLEGMIDRAANGQTVFLSSHQIHEVERVADWVGILHQGKLQVVAPLENLKSDFTLLYFSQRDTLLPIPTALSASQIVHQSCTGRSWRVILSGWSQTLESELVRDANLFDIQTTRPSLEDLYVAFTHREGTSGSAPYIPNAGLRTDRVESSVA